MATPNWPAIRAGIFAGESGGDYDALFGFSNRPGGRFSNVRLTDMTVDQALAFADPSGPYAQWTKGKVGRVATPMGAYQVVGTTLRAAKNGLGLSGNERMTPETQERIGQWIAANQGLGAWAGYRGPRDPSSFPAPPTTDFTGPVSERPLASFNDMGGGFGQMFSGLPFGDPNAPPDPMRFGDVQGPYTPAQEYDEMGGTMMAGAPGTGGAWGGGSGGIPRSVSDYATNDKDDGFFSRMGRALTKMEQSQRPIGGGFRGGASNGNALLEVLNSPTIKDLLLKKRLV